MVQVGTYYNDLDNSSIPFNNKQQAITAEGLRWIDKLLLLPSILDVDPRNKYYNIIIFFFIKSNTIKLEICVRLLHLEN